MGNMLAPSIFSRVWIIEMSENTTILTLVTTPVGSRMYVNDVQIWKSCEAKNGASEVEIILDLG